MQVSPLTCNVRVAYYTAVLLYGTNLCGKASENCTRNDSVRSRQPVYEHAKHGGVFGRPGTLPRTRTGPGSACPVCRSCGFLTEIDHWIRSLVQIPVGGRWRTGEHEGEHVLKNVQDDLTKWRRASLSLHIWQLRPISGVNFHSSPT